MNAQQRKRIVINLEQPPQGVKASGRGPHLYKVFGLLAIGLAAILLVAGISAYLWWRHYQTTATYSLALIVDAAQRNDMATFNRQVDTDKIVDNLASQAAERAAAGIGVSGLVLSNPLGSVSPVLPARLKTMFRDWLADEIKHYSAEFGQKPFIVIALSLPAVVNVTNEENTARIEATLGGRPVELTMKREDEIWKLVALKDDGLITRALAEVGKDLPAIAPLDAVEPGKVLKRRRR
ncbi:MAG TPA: hypothetical protein VJ180_06160 [Pyrinomonadaceae bacterium]|nr:hypothetical protein [Pyrinomonadaceae bacterium]